MEQKVPVEHATEKGTDVGTNAEISVENVNSTERFRTVTLREHDKFLKKRIMVLFPKCSLVLSPFHLI